MGREDEGHRLAADHDRRTRRQGNRPERDALHHPRRPLCDRLRKAQGPRLPASLAIGTGRERGEGEDGQQDEIHMPGVRTERMGQAGRSVNLRCVLRGQRPRNLLDAGRTEPGEHTEAAQRSPAPCQLRLVSRWVISGLRALVAVFSLSADGVPLPIGSTTEHDKARAKKKRERRRFGRGDGRLLDNAGAKYQLGTGVRR